LDNDFKQSSRSGYRAKRRKTNLILNSLIVVVVLLILFVAYNIFASDNDETASPKTPKTEQKQSVQKEKTANKASEQKTSADDNSSTEETAGDTQDQDETAADKTTTDGTKATDGADQSQAVVSNGGASSNVLKTIENPAWKPIGTSQTGEHTPQYSSSSIDWQEMLNAISYATGLEQSNMTVYWLGRDRSTENASVGTVYSKDKQQKYRVYIKWVDGEGWMPTKVEELAQLEK